MKEKEKGKDPQVIQEIQKQRAELEKYYEKSYLERSARLYILSFVLSILLAHVPVFYEVLNRNKDQQWLIFLVFSIVINQVNLLLLDTLNNVGTLDQMIVDLAKDKVADLFKEDIVLHQTPIDEVIKRLEENSGDLDQNIEDEKFDLQEQKSK